MDFGIFGVTPEQVEQFRAFVASQQGQGAGGAGGNGNNNGQQPNETNGSGSGNGASGDGQSGPVFMHTAPHPGVVCDICESEILGYRYKCAQCPDFDLCSKCEHQGHHAGHVMLRIPFPEQSRDAIRKYLSNAPNSCPPSPPAHGPGRHGHPHGHGHGPHHHGPHPHGPAGFGLEDHPFFGGRRGHCHRRGHHGGEDAERPATAPGKPKSKPCKMRKSPSCMLKKGRIEKRCPYNMGKKEFKKWSKWAKKAAVHQHRSAEAWARANAASGNGNASAGSDSETESPMDFAAVASQIQEFLNYWGIPVDVVELYDQFGNGARGEQRSAENPGQQAEGNTNANTAESQQNQASTSNAAEGENAGASAPTVSGAQEAQTQATAATSSITENMQQMRINENQNGASASAPRDEAMLVELDAENSGWTILNDSRDQSPTGSNTEGRPQTGAAPSAPLQQNESQSTSSSTSMNSNVNKGNQTPFVSASGSTTNGNGAQQPPTVPPTGPAYPAGLPGVPLYPVLNPPQIQQILQGVSSAVNSVVRNIPIVSDPRGPFGTNVTNATTGQVPSAAAGAPAAEVELDARSMKTLNQLLAMGFSNEGGYLTRLVVAKKGDLEAVLSSLFPN